MSAIAASADAGEQHRRALAVRRLAGRVRQVARADDDIAEDRLDLHRARAVVHLDLGAGAGAHARRRSRRVVLGRRRRVLRSGRRDVSLLGRRRVSLLRRRRVRLLGRRRVGLLRRGHVSLGRRRLHRRREATGVRASTARRGSSGLGRRRDGGLRLEEAHDDPALAEHDLVARLEARLVDALAIDQCSARRAEVDDVHVIGPGDFDDGVHARDRLVVDPQVRGSQLPDLDHVLVQDLFADQLVPFVDFELEGDLDVGHWCSPVSFVVSRFG